MSKLMLSLVRSLIILRASESHSLRGSLSSFMCLITNCCSCSKAAGSSFAFNKPQCRSETHRFSGHSRYIACVISNCCDGISDMQSQHIFLAFKQGTNFVFSHNSSCISSSTALKTILLERHWYPFLKPTGPYPAS